MKIVFTGGGSGGHVIPNLAIIPYLSKDFNQIHYIGGAGIEKDIISTHKNITYHQIACAKLRRSLSIKNLAMPFIVIKGLAQSFQILKQIKPDIIFSKGGYVAVPVVIAGKMLGIPIIGHESDISMGLANKIIYKMSTTFCTSFEITSLNHKKCIVTGSPIRKEILNGNKLIAQSKYNLSSRPTLLVMGGSLGAKKLNDAIFALAKRLSHKFNIIHITGKGKLNNNIKLNNYIQLEYTSDIPNILAISDLVVSRAGSNSIFEFACARIPMILIPLSKAQSRGDQILNAQEFEKQKLATVISEDDLTEELLYDKIVEVYNNRDKIKDNMKKSTISNGAPKIASLLYSTAQKTKKLTKNDAKSIKSKNN